MDTANCVCLFDSHNQTTGTKSGNWAWDSPVASVLPLCHLFTQHTFKALMCNGRSPVTEKYSCMSHVNKDSWCSWFINEKVHEACVQESMEKSYLLWEAKPRFCEMCEEITSFMGSKRNVVVKLEDESRSDLSFLCDVAEYFSAPECLNVKLEGHKPGIHEYACAVKGNPNKTAFTGRAGRSTNLGRRFTNLDAHK